MTRPRAGLLENMFGFPAGAGGFPPYSKSFRSAVRPPKTAMQSVPGALFLEDKVIGA